METFETVEQLRRALIAFKERYDRRWLVERHGHRTPGRCPAGALAEQQGCRMITASEVSKKPGAVHPIDNVLTEGYTGGAVTPDGASLAS